LMESMHNGMNVQLNWTFKKRHELAPNETKKKI
jgi:hypothetical protein